MAIQVVPAQASHVARAIRAVISQNQFCVRQNLLVFKMYANAIQSFEEVVFGEFFVILGMVVRENDIVGFGLCVILSTAYPDPGSRTYPTVSTCLDFVQCS